MGIKGNFRTHIQTKYPSAFSLINLCTSDCDIKSVAIDVIGLVYSYKMVYPKDAWLQHIEDLLTKMVRFGVEPIVVFEGKSPPEKANEQEARKQRKRLVYDKIENLSRDLIDIKNGLAPSQLVTSTLASIKKPNLPNKDVYTAILCLEGGKNVVQFTNSEDADSTVSTIQSIETYLEKLKRQSSGITEEDLDNVVTVCERMGLIYVFAPGEAEQACAWLCINKHVDAVLSEDSDLIPLLCPRILTRSRNQNGTLVLFCLETFLNESKLTRSQLVDWAIMCGTDYNQSIPKVGVVKSLELITRYETIENIKNSGAFQKYSKDISRLDYENVRRLFDCSKIDDAILSRCVERIGDQSCRDKRHCLQLANIKRR
jgi:5'-3' exonuclease